MEQKPITSGNLIYFINIYEYGIIIIQGVDSLSNKEIYRRILKFANLAENNNKIDFELYDKFGVKRGLRNKNGTGVLAGLTEIGDVIGYRLDDGEKIPTQGSLLYRGIDVKDIVDGFQSEERFGFEEVCYLLLFGSLPTSSELKEFNEILGESREIPEGFTEDMILKAPSPNIMNKLARSVLATYSYDDNPDDTSIENMLRQCIELIARFPILVAYAFQAKSHYYDNNSLYIHNTTRNLSTAENFLHMLRVDNKFTKSEAELLDLCLVLHAEHGGGNNSAFTARVVSSSGTDTYSAIAAAIGSLKGPKHGGANNKVRQMMDDIKAHIKDWEDKKEIENYLTKILKKEANDGSGLIYGMGHAIYTLSDPRAVMLKKKAHQLAIEKDMMKEYNLYQSIENLAPEVFAKVKGSSKEICANVDFYSGFVYNMLQIPPELFTPIFAIARIGGWCAHRIEEFYGANRIIRPAYKNITEPRDYKNINNRY
ncbi:citrate/2-methylcitrate synthase [Vallitalea guaymasensis]|uniref:citrate synthase (unknown stereospecificity) n=1 Tax=Vallitalea guaymasensis TaxID=1185412 RepID=A0A8J8SAJ5_9FIRM|nr:citrate/2-methylcitrate synthase [Vallitalea guaymasensis]